jgi:hypothetical protein
VRGWRNIAAIEKDAEIASLRLRLERSEAALRERAMDTEDLDYAETFKIEQSNYSVSLEEHTAVYKIELTGKRGLTLRAAIRAAREGK